MAKAVGYLEVVAGAVIIAFTGWTGVGAYAGYGLIASGLATIYEQGHMPELDTPTADSQAPQAEMVTATDVYGNLVYGEALVGGILLYRNVTGANNELLDYVVIHAYTRIEPDGSCLGVEGFGDLYLDDKVIKAADIDASGNVTAGDYKDMVQVWRYDGSQTTASAELLSAYGSDPDDPWLATDIFKGVVYTHIRFKGDTDQGDAFQKAFGGAAPHKVQTVMQGEKVYDPVTDTTAYSTNNALCARDFLTRTDNGCGFDASVLNDSIGSQSANECDETITYPGTSRTGPRFTLNGVVQLGNSRRDTLTHLLASMAGELTQAGGTFAIYSGSFTPSSGVIDDSFLRGGVSINEPTDEDRYNYVKASFLDKNNAYQQMPAPPFPAIGSQTYTDWTAADGGRIDKAITLKFVNNADNAQVIEQIIGNQSRYQKTVTIECNYRGKFCEVGSRWTLDFPNIALGGLYKVVNAKPNADHGVDLVLRRDDQIIYGWDNTIAQEGPYIGTIPGVRTIPPVPQNIYARPQPDGIGVGCDAPPAHKVDYIVFYRASAANGTFTPIYRGSNSFTDHLPNDNALYYYKAQAFKAGEPSGFSATVSSKGKIVADGANVGATIGTDLKDGDGNIVGADDALNSHAGAAVINPRFEGTYPYVSTYGWNFDAAPGAVAAGEFYAERGDSSPYAPIPTYLVHLGQTGETTAHAANQRHNPVEPGQMVAAQVAIRAVGAVNAGAYARATINWVDSTGAGLSQDASDITIGPGGTYANVANSKLTKPAPANAAGYYVGVQYVNHTAGYITATAAVSAIQPDNADSIPESGGRKWAAESGAQVFDGKPFNKLTGRTADNLNYTAGGTVDSFKPAEAGAEKTTGKSVDVLTQGTNYRLVGAGYADDNGRVVNLYDPAGIKFGADLVRDGMNRARTGLGTDGTLANQLNSVLLLKDRVAANFEYGGAGSGVTLESLKPAAAGADPTASNFAKGTGVADVTTTNQPPSWYRANYAGKVVAELKTRAAISAPGSDANVTARTKVPGAKTTDGVVVQEANTDYGLFVRTGTADDSAWNPWSNTSDSTLSIEGLANIGLTDTKGLGLTADWQNVNAPSPLKAIGESETIQLALPEAEAPDQIYVRQPGGEPYLTDRLQAVYANGVIDLLSGDLVVPGTWQDFGNQIRIPNPGATPISVTAGCTANAIGSGACWLSIAISLDGGATWGGGRQGYNYHGTGNMSVSVEDFIAGTATGDILIKVRARDDSGSNATTIRAAFAHLWFVMQPYVGVQWALLTSPLAVSVPSTAAGYASKDIALGSTATASAKVKASTSGGSGGYQYSWSKTTGPNGEASDSSSVVDGASTATCTVTSTHTTADPAAVYHTYMHVVVTDSQPQSVTSATCDVTLQYARTANPVTATGVNGECSCSTIYTQQSCTAQGTLKVGASGGDGNYSYSWSNPAGNTGSIVSGATTNTVTVSRPGVSPGSASESYTVTVTDGVGRFDTGSATMSYQYNSLKGYPQ